MYSLGMTMLFGAEYNASQSDGMMWKFSDQLQMVTSAMTIEEYEERIEMHEVMTICHMNLADHSSEKISQNMASIAKFDSMSSIDGRYKYANMKIIKSRIIIPFGLQISIYVIIGGIYMHVDGHVG